MADQEEPKAKVPPSRKLAEHTLRALEMPVIEDYRRTEVDYQDIAPRPFTVQISLVEYFERIKRYKADRWQQDFCNRLQHACENRHLGGMRASIHAEAQLGKSSILAQCFPAWILGHDPLHRIALSTYNVTRSQAHSKAVIGIINLPIHKAIFPDQSGWVPANTSKEKWQTNARRDQTTDAQDSFNPVGLQSGLTGSGFDTLIIDDPYADQKEAFSETVRKNLQEFWDFTVMSRIAEHSNVFGMFHRYHIEDLAGYLLNTGTFDYWRYATIADGPYIHDETGQKFEDPLGRAEGEYISPERRSPAYYADNMRNKRVWMSMFQGRPSAEEGEFFMVGKIAQLPQDTTQLRMVESAVLVRGWDHAATEEGGDYSVGGLLGMKADGTATIFNVKRRQLETAGRNALQKATAEADGHDVVITVPQDPGAAGKSVVEDIQRRLQGYSVAVRPTSGTKADRARALADAVNSGLVSFGCEDDLPESDRWHKHALREFRNFPLSDHDDIIDALADAYNEALERIAKGPVIRNYKSHTNLALWSQFGVTFQTNGKPLDKIPSRWTIYAAAKITPEATTPNSAVLVARAPRNTYLEDTIFVVAEYKAYTADPAALFEWLDLALECYCENTKNTVIWLHPDSSQYRQTIWQKIKKPVAIFEGDAKAGLSELDWYLHERDYPSPFNADIKATGLYGLIADPAQFAVAVDEYGLRSMRQEFATWNFNDKGEPSAIGAVLDCLRMITHAYRTVAADLTHAEKIEHSLAPALRTDAIQQEENLTIKTQLLQRRMIETQKVERDLNRPVRGAHASRFGRR